MTIQEIAILAEIAGRLDATAMHLQFVSPESMKHELIATAAQLALLVRLNEVAAA